MAVKFCTDCDFKCTTKSKLDEHLKTHTVSKLLDEFVCELCSKVFPTAAKLRRHLKSCEKTKKRSVSSSTVTSQSQEGDSAGSQNENPNHTIKELMFNKMQSLLEAPNSLPLNENTSVRPGVTIENMSLLIKKSLEPDKKSRDVSAKACPRRNTAKRPVASSTRPKIQIDGFLEKMELLKKSSKNSASSLLGIEGTEDIVIPGCRFDIEKSRKRKKKPPAAAEESDASEGEENMDLIKVEITDDESSTDGKAFKKHKVERPKEVDFACSSCSKTFSRKYHLDRHLRLSACSGLPPPTFPCGVCNRVYSRKDNLREHLRQHTGEAQRAKNYKCDNCDKAFHGRSLLTIHARTHSGEKPYTCEFCPKKFPSTGALTKHTRTHTGEKPFKCPTCEHSFSLKGTLKRHLRVHTGMRPHKCAFCPKEFIQIGGLKAHMFYHTGENGFKCDECGKIFNRKARLQMHQQYVHVKVRPYVCSLCKKNFTRKEDLQRHSVLHTGEKPYKCPSCPKTFAIKPSLKLHLLTHTKEEPRSCHECGRAFIRKDCLMRHMRKRHRDLLDKILLDEKNDEKFDSSSGTPRILGKEDLCENITELLSLLVEESTLVSFGWPTQPVDQVLEAVIRRCGHTPVSQDQYAFMDRMRENAKLLFTVVIDDNAVKTLLNNQTVDEVILHVLRLAKT